MSEEKTATVIGFTGLVGSLVTKFLLSDPYYTHVRILVRRPVSLQHPKLEIKLVDFKDTEWLKLSLENSSAVFSCIGTTIKKVEGDKKLYWQIDHDIPVRVCRLARETGCRKFLLVSSIGANPKSRNFYTRLKGQTEQDVIGTGMPAVHIMRPGMLLGNREEHRPMEKMFQYVMPRLSGLMNGKSARFRAIEAEDVARAMIAASETEQEEGVYKYTYNEMKALSQKYEIAG
jgi:uncharacterized protein YbjT (DUF2867 family)